MNSRRPIRGRVEATDWVVEGADELLPSSLRLEHDARADERTEVRCVLPDGIIDGLEAELDDLAFDRWLGADCAKDFVDVSWDPPQRRGLHAWRRRRHERPGQCEQLAHEAVVDPGRHRDPSSGSADADKLAGCSLVIGREHRPERRGHAIEAGALKRQLLGIALDPLDVNAGLVGTSGRAFEKLWCVMSRPTTSAPSWAAGIARLPALPVPTSSSLTPGAAPTRSITTPPTGLINRAKWSQPPADHVARAWRRKLCRSTIIRR